MKLQINTVSSKFTENFMFTEFKVPEGECGRLFMMRITNQIPTFPVCSEETYHSRIVAGDLPECSQCFIKIIQEAVRQRPQTGERFNGTANRHST